jgi:hypothetical protein
MYKSFYLTGGCKMNETAGVDNWEGYDIACREDMGDE